MILINFYYIVDIIIDDWLHQIILYSIKCKINHSSTMYTCTNTVIVLLFIQTLKSFSFNTFVKYSTNICFK